MCKKEPDQLEAIVREAVAGCPPTGSRKRRLWELGDHAHCPVIGVCLPIAVLRRTVDKVLGGQAVADDYDLHCGVIAECQRRTRMAEAVQRELDQRYKLSLQQAAKHKTVEALASWWQEASRGRDLAGVLWATLSHARCTPALEHHVLGEIHMIQHQIGTVWRADLQRFESLIDENAILARALGAAQARHARLAQEHARRHEQQESQIVQLRAELMGRDTALAALREQVQALEAAMPGLKGRLALAQEARQHIERIHQLERSLLQSRQEAERHQRRVEELFVQAQTRAPAPPWVPMGPPDRGDGVLLVAADPARLVDQSVLCVGGRQASVPIYRQLVERRGGRFLHHDGGDEDNVAKLDATLAAADLVICQTGCISHDAYWRVKDHCKRTGKPCVFVETPSAAGLKRALLMLKPMAHTQAHDSEPAK